MTLEAKLKDIQKKLWDSNFPNERSISQGIVLPILRELNWDTDNTSLVWPEYTVGGGLADFALCGNSDNPKVFIEVKKLGGVEKAEKKAQDQVMRYAHNKDVRIVVLTDGRTWSLYLPEKGGMGYDGKRVFKLDILDRPPQESSEVLQRYLEKSRVVSDKALETARVIFFLRKHRKNNPGMWKEPFERAVGLVRALHHLVPIALAEEIGTKSAQDNIDPDIVDYFHSLLREEISQSSSGTTAQRMQPESPAGGRVSDQPSSGSSERKQPVQRRVRRVSATPPSGASGSSPSEMLVILDKAFPCKSATDAMIEVFKELERREQGFYQRFYNSRWNRGKTRQVIAQDPRELYDDPSLKENPYASRPLSGGWFIATNNSKSTIERHINKAVKVEGLKLKFEKDIFRKGIIINF